MALKDPRLDLARRLFKRKTGNAGHARIVNVNGSPYVSGSNGYVWVKNVEQVATGDFTVTSNIWAVRHAPGVGLYIKAGRIVVIGEQDGELQILRNYTQDMDAAGVSIRQTNVSDESRKFIPIENLVNLNVFTETIAGTTVAAYPSIYRKADGDYGIYESETGVELSSYIPSDADNQRVVALWLDPATNAVTITASSEVSLDTNLKLNPSTALTYINECAQLAPVHAIGLYSYLVYGTTQDGRQVDKFYDLRGMLGSSIGQFTQIITSTYTIVAGEYAYFVDPVRIEGSITVNGGMRIL
jgi:hypothetical protein